MGMNVVVKLLDEKQLLVEQLAVANAEIERLDGLLDTRDGELNFAEGARLGLEGEIERLRARLAALARALTDAVSTYDPKVKEIIVTAERQEAWSAVLKQNEAWVPGGQK